MTTFYPQSNFSASGQTSPPPVGQPSPPPVILPAEIYSLLLSVYQLHEFLLWGPVSGEFLPIIQKVREAKGLSKDAQSHAPPTEGSLTVPENGADPGRKPSSGRRASMGVENSSAVAPPRWVLKARKRIIRRWRRINPRTRFPLLRDMPDDALWDLDNELQQKVEAFLAQKSTPPPPSPRVASRPDRQPRTPPPPPPREVPRPDQQHRTPPPASTVDDDDEPLPAHSDDVDGEPSPALDVLPAHTDANLAAKKIQAMLRRRNATLRAAATTAANLAAEKIQAMLRRRNATLRATATPPSPNTELFELLAQDADAHARAAEDGGETLPADDAPPARTVDDDDESPSPALDVLPAHTDDVDNEPTDDAAAAEPDGVPAQGLETELACAACSCKRKCSRCSASDSKYGDRKTKRERRKKPQTGIFWNLGKAPRAAKHAPDAGSHSPDDPHVRDEPKLTPNKKTTASACSSDFIPPAPESSFYTSAVSSPRDESSRKDGSFTWFCPGCNRLNDTQENGSMCPICHWPVEPDPSVRSQTRSSRDGCEDARANAREPDPLLRTHTRFTRKDYEDAMAPAGSHVHKRWLDRDPYPDCDSDEPFFSDNDSEGGYVEYGFGEG